MSIPKQDERTPEHRYEVRDDVLLRIVYADVAVACFANEESREHVEQLCRLLNFKDQRIATLEGQLEACNAYGRTDALRSALAHIADYASGPARPTTVPGLQHIEECARAALSSSPAPSTEGLREALAEMIYETTHLSPENPDGGHRCIISGATLEKARTAPAGITAPSEVVTE